MGGVVGGVVLVSMIAGLAYFVAQKKKRREAAKVAAVHGAGEGVVHKGVDREEGVTMRVAQSP